MNSIKADDFHPMRGDVAINNKVIFRDGSFAVIKEADMLNKWLIDAITNKPLCPKCYGAYELTGYIVQINNERDPEKL